MSLTDHKSLNPIRQSLDRLIREATRSLNLFTTREPVMKGSVYEMRTRCGKPNCKCARGEKHRSLVVSWSEGGKRCLRVVPPARRLEVQTLTRRYQKLRKARARMVTIFKQVLALMDRLEGIRRKAF